MNELSPRFCAVCNSRLHQHGSCEMLFDGIIRPVCRDCYKEAFIKTNKERIIKSINKNNYLGGEINGKTI